MIANTYDLMKSVSSKTLCDDFDEQLDLSEFLYGNNIHFSFSIDDVKHLLDTVTIYSNEEKARIQDIMSSQIRKYQYLFE